MDISQREDYTGKFNDKRLDRRAMQLSSMLYFGRSSSIHEMAVNEAEQKAAYRFLSNGRVEEQTLIKTVVERSSYLCADKELLVIQDTTEINLANHHRRLKPKTGIGLTGNNKDLGFFLHGSIVLDAATETILGFSDIQLWHREEDKLDKHERKYARLPIEQKESYKWIKACDASKVHLSAASGITFIEDREGDIYEQFARVPDSRTHLIVRCCRDRKLAGEGSLYEALAACEVSGTYQVELVKDIRKGIESRIAEVEVKFCKVAICKPAKVKSAGKTTAIELYAIEVRETGTTDTNPILWRILTTHCVESYEQALVIIGRYRLRWYIEQLFRLLKKKGFRIEDSELETGWAARKLLVMLLNTALRVMQLYLSYDNAQSQAIGQMFDQQEIACLQSLNNTLQGDTASTGNQNNPGTIAWATWVIARLGGWKGYDRKRPPGPLILKRGLDKFNDIYTGWKIAIKQT